MTGTFSSFNTALSALRYQRLAMDVASNNIANSGTAGFVRRRAEAQSLGAPITASVWSRYEGGGDGVASAGITRLSDALLDARSRTEHGRQSFLDTRATALDRVETGLGEPGDHGVAAALQDFRDAWQALETQPDNTGIRTIVLATGRALTDALHAQASNVSAEQTTQRGHLLDSVAEVNSVAHDLAEVNRSLAVAAVNQLDDSDLRDQRDVLGQRLAELTGAVTTPREDGGLDVSVGGRSLVAGSASSVLTITGGVAADGSDSGTALMFAVGGQAVAPGAVGGEVGGVGELLTTTLPALATGLDAVAVQLATSVNSLHTDGYDQDGNAGTAFFAYDATGAAASLRVALVDPRSVAASDQPGGGTGTGTAEALGDTSAIEASYQRLVTGFGTDVASARRLSTTQQLLTSQVDNGREQLSGVSFDEETANLVAAQRAYEAAARVITTMDEVLDTLINRMAR